MPRILLEKEESKKEMARIYKMNMEALEKAVLSRVPRGTEELNRKALSEGYNLVQNK
jgi:Pyruvate/2-oxoacid:ferredoxin oxidoreductase gamma subunit